MNKGLIFIFNSPVQQIILTIFRWFPELELKFEEFLGLPNFKIAIALKFH